MINVSNSAKGTDNHNPSIPQILGRININATMNTSVRSTDMIAEIRPLENAENIDDAKILNPANTKFQINII